MVTGPIVFYNKENKAIKMKLVNKLQRLIYGGQWYVAYRNIGTEANFRLCQVARSEYCADPFVIEENGEIYIFCEQYKKRTRKGCIGYFKVVDGIPINKGIVLECPYHLSYPCVFKYNNCIYMIPESGENKTVELYKAVEFPNKWEKARVLLSGKGYVDTTVVIDKDDVSLLTYYRSDGKNILEKYSLSTTLSNAEKVCEKLFESNTGRGAGAIYKENNSILIRPSQNCVKSYGENIIMNRIIRNDTVYDEVPQRMISKENVIIEDAKNIVGIHTYACNYGYEVIDLFSRKIDLTYTIGNHIAKMKRIRKLMKQK